MNFRQLNESFDRLNEKILNEGPGAGYSFNGTFYPQSVSSVKIIKQSTNKYNDLEIYFTANIQGVVDIEFESYDYHGELEDVPVVGTEGYICIGENETYNPNEIEQYIAQFVQGDTFSINHTYGGGWSHSTYDGTLSTNEDPTENTYADVQIFDLHIESQEIIDEIDLTVQGKYEDDEYYEEDYTPKVRRFKSCDGTGRIINQYYEDPDYENRSKGERNHKEITDKQYNDFLVNGKFQESFSDNHDNAFDDVKVIDEARSNYGGKKGPFWYYTKHGIGPGTLPKDVQVVDIYEDDDFGTYVALDSILTTDELQQYEMKEQNPPER